MKALFLIGAVAKRPRPVRERPIRKALLRAISSMYDDSRPCNHIGAGARLISRPSPPGAHVLSSRLGYRGQGARQARICPRGFLVGRCSASSAGRFPRTFLTVKGFAGAGGVVDFGGKRAAGGTFGCSACDVCFIRSAKFSAGAEFDEAEAHSARFASIAASCARACASSSCETTPAGL